MLSKQQQANSTSPSSNFENAEKHIRYAIIGSGMMGQEHIRNVKLLGDTSVVAVADPDEAMRAGAAALAGPECKAYSDYRDLLAADGADAIIVASPNHTHVAILRDLLTTEVPIIVEKPLCTTLDDCREIASLGQNRKAPVWVAMEYRYMPPVQRLIHEIEAGTAGNLHMVSIREHRYPFLHKVGNWNRFARYSGGTLVEKCCHFFDLMRLISKSEAVRVYASGGKDVNYHDEMIDGQRPDILDNAFVIVDFANGVRAMLDLCMFAEGAYWQESIAATGDVARVEAFVPGPARFSAHGKERYSEIVISPRVTKIERREPIHVDETILSAGDHHGSTFFQHQKFLNLVRSGDGKVEVSLEDGMKAVMIGAAAEESVRTGRAIDLR
jgi:myo-inositol 2-dehydrogenase/D-chiro-inositol 1-dehydrogenase